MRKIFPLISLMLVFYSCSSTRNLSGKEDGKISIVFLQINDVYEIAPLAGGKEGGMARVAQLKKELVNKNPNTFLLMAGDFLSPSVYNSLIYEGQRVRGRQMVETMNASGVDFAVFGNHEFDISETELQSRLNESAFEYISSNSFHKKNDSILPFTRFLKTGKAESPVYKILRLKDADGSSASIGLFGITLPFNRAGYVHYTDALGTARKMYQFLKDSCDAVVAITHQSIEDDIVLAREIPELAAIIGGHEHHMIFERIGNVPITKAHANARSAYIVQIDINKKKAKRKVSVKTAIRMVDESIQPDSATTELVKKWVSIADSSFSSIGFDAQRVILEKGDPLDAREEVIRHKPSNFGQLIARAVSEAAPLSDLSLLNSGSIRLDDLLHPPVTEYDIIRSLPYGGPVLEAEIRGKLLLQVLNAGLNNKGNGGFIISSPTEFDLAANTWKIGGRPLDPARVYRVAVSDFLFSGNEANLDFFNRNNPDVIQVFETTSDKTNPLSDIRLAIVRYLEKLNRAEEK